MATSKITRAEFESFFPQISADVVQAVKEAKLPQNAVDWVETSLKYNVTGGKYNRGMSVVDSVRILKGGSLTAAEVRQSAILGWLIEFLQAFFLVSDDIMDGSKTRRDQPCWYLRPEVGMIAINDAFMIEMAIYKVLKAEFRKHPAYADFVDLFQDMTWKTEMGQLCDLLTAPEDKVDLDNFSFDKFNFIVRYKTSYYSFYLSIALALYYCEIATPKNIKQSLDILLPMGDYFQAQDDFLDWSAPPEILGKIGTDIQDNKCSWVVNTALKKATPEQRQILDENYGRKDAAKEKVVKELFETLGIRETYAQFEEETVTKIKSLIEGLDETEGLKKGVFEAFLAKIYKRSK